MAIFWLFLVYSEPLENFTGYKVKIVIFWHH